MLVSLVVTRSERCLGSFFAFHSSSCSVERKWEFLENHVKQESLTRMQQADQET